MNLIRDRIWSLDEFEIKRVIADWEEFEKLGYTGNSAIRDIANEHMIETHNSGSSQVVRIMYDFAFEAYRYFYEKRKP